MEQSVEHLCNLLARSRLLAAEEIRALRQRWRGAGGAAAADAAAFSQWLVAKEYLTDYQATMLLRGHADHFFLGPYKVLERIGKGRMAGVYKATHTLGQLVAIKVLPPSKAKDAALLARFQREARMALRLKNPHVVRTFQTGESDGLHYLVMEYLDGETLEEVLQRRGRLTPPEAARVIHQALLGLQHIHEQGLVHRDLKPANLMLLPAAAPGRDSTLPATVKVMDIGLGRELFDETEGGGAPQFHLTNTGALLGTPDYLAPEQARDARSADVRADIYSLGCVLYHALAGKPPFPDDNLLRQLMRHASEAPRPLHEVNPAVPEGLEQIVGWMMAKDPAKRYPTPERAAQALQVFLTAGAEATAAPPPRMKAYLDWLEAQPKEPEAAAPPPTPPPPRAVPAEGPQQQNKRRTTSRPRPKPSRATAAKTPAAKGVEQLAAEDFDVELVPATPVKGGRPRRKDEEDEPDDAVGGMGDWVERKLGLSRRDLLMLGLGAGIGAGAMLILGGLGWLVFWLLSR
jgi:serine/threonine protein kinase